MIAEFQEFINRGNVVDLAVAVVLGAAFTPVVNAVVERLLMPLIALSVGQPNFDSIGQFACEGATCAGSVGAVITAIINFLLVALAVFLIVKVYNRMSRGKSPEQDDTVDSDADPDDVVLLREIRDALV
ncbi:MAG: large conductance mechanosensitive channel protein MscL, partial [Nitriliruptor sp.]